LTRPEAGLDSLSESSRDRAAIEGRITRFREGTSVAVEPGMSTSSKTTFHASLFLAASLSLAAFGCAPAPQTCPPSTSAGTAQRLQGAGERHIYRFDFVLTGTDGTNPPSSTSFTMVIQEGEKGEVVVGKNVALVPAAPPGSASAPASPRQDVGTKVAAFYRTSGDDVVLEVSTEMSAFEPPTSIRKMVSKGNAIASPGKSSLVTSLVAEHKHVQLTVTPTKLR
jgi:hypothetical protein